MERGELRRWKRLSYELLCELPSSTIPLVQWSPLVRTVLNDFLPRRGLTTRLDLSIAFNIVDSKRSRDPVASFVKAPRLNDEVTVKVIHQAKGETYDAVMVVADAGSGNRPDDLTQWLSPDGNSEEERRVGYVAVTRPRKLLVLAIPANTSDQLVQQLSPHFEFSDCSAAE